MDPWFSLNKTRNIVDDFSTAELSLDKNQTGPPFVFRETDTMFILTSNLKGNYKRENIKVEINKAGKRVAIFGEKPVQERMMVGNNVYKTETKMRGFKRAFRFSDGVIFDKIKAMFNEQDFLLTISVPKMERRGFRVTRIEEVKHEDIGTNYESLKIENVEEERDKDAVEVDKEEDLEKSEVVQELDNPQIDAMETLEDQEFKVKQESINIDPNEAQHVQEPDKIDKEEELEKNEAGQELDYNPQIDSMETLKDQELEAKQESTNIDPNEAQHVIKPDKIQINSVKDFSGQEFEGEEETSKLIHELDNPQTDLKETLKHQGFEAMQESIDIEPNNAQHIQEPDKIQTDSVKDFSCGEFEGEEEEKRKENEGEGAIRDECPKRKKNKCKLCDPMILGTTILVIISGLVIYVARNQNPHRKRKN